MKKLLSIIMLSTLLTSIASCGKSEQQTKTEETALPTVTPIPTELPIETEEPLLSVEDIADIIASCYTKDELNCEYIYDKELKTVTFYLTIIGLNSIVEDASKLLKSNNIEYVTFAKDTLREITDRFDKFAKDWSTYFTEDGYDVTVSLVVLDDVLKLPVYVIENGESTIDLINH